MKLSILLLGPPLIRWGDEPVTIQRRLLRLLLYYLACQPNPVSRDELIVLLWPDISEEVGRRRLRELLSKLRTQLPDETLLVTNSNMVGLDFDRVTVDVRLFTEIVKKTEKASNRIDRNTPLPAALYRQKLEGVRLWRSGRFMAGTNNLQSETYDHWFSDISSQLEAVRRSMLERLADHAAASNNLEEAIQFARLGLEGDEFNTEMHLRILNGMNLLGRRTEALNYCTYLRTLFQVDAGFEMPANLDAFCQQIRDQGELPAGNPVLQLPELGLLRTPFIGREAELLDAILCLSRHQPLLISGEAGSGKTRLVYECLNKMMPAPHVFSINASSTLSKIPFQAVIDSLRHHITIETWEKLDHVWRSHLNALVPELLFTPTGSVATQVPAHTDSERLLFEALYQLLLVHLADQQAVILLDNIHWLDQPSLNLVAFLVKRGFFSSSRECIITIRDEKLSGPLTELLDTLQPHRVKLGPLSIEAAGQIIQAIYGRTPSDETVQQLHQETHGNPFYLIETLTALIEFSPAGSLDQNQGDLPLTGSILSLIQERLQRLNKVSLNLLRFAAVFGEDFTPELMQSATGLSMEQIVSSLEDLEWFRLIQPVSTPDGDEMYSFTQKMIRETVCRQISLARRRDISRRLADALEHCGHTGTQHILLLARLHESGGDFAAAFRCWLQAAEKTHHRYSKTETYEAYRQAQSLLVHHLFAFNTDDYFNLMSNWLHAAIDYHDTELVRELAENMVQSGNRHQDALHLGTGLSYLSHSLANLDQLEEAYNTIKSAVSYLQLTDNLPELIRAYIRLGFYATYLNRHQDALAAYHKVVALTQGSSDPGIIEQRIDAEYHMATALYARGWPAQAADVAQKTLDTYSQYFFPAAFSRIHLVLAMSKFQLLDMAGSLAECSQILSSGVGVQNVKLNAWAHLVSARCLLNTGEIDRMWEHLTIVQQYRLDELYQDVHEELCTLLGDSHRLMGSVEPAIAAYCRSGISKVVNFETMRSQVHLVHAYMLSGELDQAGRLLNKLLEAAREAELGDNYLVLEIIKSELHFQQGEIPLSQQEMQVVIDEAKKRQINSLPFFGAYVLGMIARVTGNYPQAREYLINALDASRRFGHYWMQVSSLYELALLNQAEGIDDPQTSADLRRVVDRLGENLHVPELMDAVAAFRREKLMPLQAGN